MHFVTVKSSFAARTRFRGKGIAHEATSRLGHHEGSIVGPTLVKVTVVMTMSPSAGQPAVKGR